MFLSSKEFCPSSPSFSCKPWLIGVVAIASLLLLGVWTQYRHAPLEFNTHSATAADSELTHRYQVLLADPASIGGNWLRTLNPSMQDVQGDLVWNTPQQTGMMRFINLPEPRAGSVYRVWIYDTHRPTKQAVLAATVSQGSGRKEWYSALNPDQAIKAPYKFVLTLEPALNLSTLPNEAQILLMVQP